MALYAAFEGDAKRVVDYVIPSLVETGTITEELGEEVKRFLQERASCKTEEESRSMLSLITFLDALNLGHGEFFTPLISERFMPCQEFRDLARRIARVAITK